MRGRERNTRREGDKLIFFSRSQQARSVNERKGSHSPMEGMA